jgi:HEAT repeat protein
VTRTRALRLVFCGTVAVSALGILAHPYSRQLLFGPTIRGEPLWSWQQSLRHYALRHNHEPSPLTRAYDWLGMQPSEPRAWPRAAPDMLPVLLSLLDDPHPEVRAEIALELASYPPSDEQSETLLRLLDDPHPRVRAMAAFSLCDLGYQAAVPKLRTYLADADDACRMYCALAVCKLCRDKQDDALNVLRAGMASSNRDTVLHATTAVCELGKQFPELLEEITAAARTDPRVRCGFALQGCCFGDAAVAPLADLLADPDRWVRLYAAGSLGRIGPDASAAIPRLQAALADTHGDVRFAARCALYKIDPVQFPESVGPP